MTLRTLLIGQLTLLWLLLSPTTAAAPQLSGIATHSELGQEQFLGALYSETLSSDAKTFLNSTNAMRMELKILAHEGIAPRRFTRLWIEGAAINIPAATMTAQAENMLAFDHLFRGRLEANDHLVFDFTPTQGTQISLNAVHLGTIIDPDFFKVLLHTWIGQVPLASNYREALLVEGDVELALLQRFTALEPDPNRITVAQDWLAASAPPVANTPAEEKPVAVSATSSANDKPAIKTIVATASSVRAIKPVNAPTPVIALPTELAKTTPEPTPEPATQQTPTKKLDDDDQLSQLTAQSLVAQQFYISAAMRKIYAKLIYPRRARELQQSGSVKMRISIDAQGNITALQPLEMSDYRLLNQAVEAAIKEAAPFPALPADIAKQQLEFAVPITFRLGQS